MTDVARRLVPIAGYAVGGMPGYIFGTILGGLLFPPQSKKAPTNIQDVKLSGPARGAPLPILFGTAKTRGNLIWAAPVTVHEPGAGGKKGGGGKGLQTGKGGATDQTTTYGRSVAYALCEGDENISLRKVWAGDDLLYDIDDPSVQLASGIDFTFYKGLSTQVADPRLSGYQSGGSTTTKTLTEQTVLNGTGPTYTTQEAPHVAASQVVWAIRKIAGVDTVVYFTKVGSGPIQDQYTVNESTGLLTFGGTYTNETVSVQYKVTTTTSAQTAIGYRYVCYIYIHEFNCGPSPALPNLQFEVRRTLGAIATDNFNRPNSNDVGGGWIDPAPAGPDSRIENNTLVQSNAQVSGQDVLYYDGGLTFGPEQFSEATIAALGGDVSGGPGVRLDTAAGRKGYCYARVRQSGNIMGHLIIDVAVGVPIAGPDFVGTAQTNVTEGTANDWGLGKVIRIEAIGTRIRGKVNGVIVVEGESSLYPTGRPGFYGHSGVLGTSSGYDNWLGGSMEMGNMFDANYAAVVKDLMTHARYGAGLSSALIDTTLYNAAQDFCIDNGLFGSGTIESPASALRHVEQVLAHYGGWVGYITGKINFGARRKETPLRTILRDDLLRDAGLEFNMPGPRDTRNLIRVDWVDRANRYTPSSKYLSDDFDRVAVGVRQEALSMPYCMTPEVASKITSRYFRMRATPGRGYSLTLGPKELDLVPGDVLALTESALGMTAETVRIASLSESEDRGEFRIDFIEEPDAGLALTQFSSEGLNPGDRPPAATEDPGPTLAAIIELPGEITAGDVIVALALAGSTDRWVGAGVYISGDGTTYNRVKQYVGASAAIGSVQEAVSALGGDRHFILPHDLDFDVDLAASSGSLLSTDRNGMLGGVNLSVLGKEFLSFRDVVLVSGARYTLKGFLRGWYDSGPLSILLNERFAVLRTDLATLRFTPDQVGRTFYLKFASINQAGVEQDIAALPAYTFTLEGLARQPDPVYGLQVYESAKRQGSRTKIGPGSIDVSIAWLYARPGNIENADLVDGTEVTGHEPDFEDYLIRVYSKATSGGSYVLRRTVTAHLTETFTYTSAQNIADAGSYMPFQKYEVMVRRKNGAVSPVKSLEVEVLP